ncbi:class I SAM-dependent methyltransferase [Owenweeksia hongkongensis]|uniref:class I SAM-dependent methyltransferase n=1 Tax=Owenweeksia hongkongensis TaxID=253245 RepID=UPI003A93ADE2
MNTQTSQLQLDYEENYHTQRHSQHVDPVYYKARAQIALTKFFRGIDTNSRILDYGCGMGQNIALLPNAMGYDISEYSVGFAKQKGINATNDLENIPEESFDYVFSSHVLEHHPHPKTMIESMHSKLKPGHDLLLIIPYERHGKGSFKLDLNQHLYTWNFQTINNLLISSGFKIKQNRYLRGAGYNKLLFLNKISTSLYFSVTNFVSRLAGIKEIMVVATKR